MENDFQSKNKAKKVELCCFQMFPLPSVDSDEVSEIDKCFRFLPTSVKTVDNTAADKTIRMTG
jgi:hypothetical protein